MFIAVKRLIVCLLILPFFSACIPQPKAAIPTPQVWPVSLDPALSWMRPMMNTCIQTMPGKTLAVTETDTPGSASIYLSWGEVSDQDFFVHSLGVDRFVMVINAGNPVERISYQMLQNIYTGVFTNWQQVNPAHTSSSDIDIWSYPASSRLQKAFSSMLNTSSYRKASGPIAPDPTAMLNAIAANPAALGWVPERWVSTGVKPIDIQDGPTDKFSIPILVYLKDDTNNEQNAWLLCIQAQISKRN